ncbi:G2-specific serine/threonine protein kinase [Arthrobotrys musiformis]|uniref:non-specific serine/threonine protein kinase n=1 Tax=Arthrobotrys musiformis TaxID=47236 RepID=A0AAV9VYN4_9PEZI
MDITRKVPAGNEAPVRLQEIPPEPINSVVGYAPFSWEPTDESKEGSPPPPPIPPKNPDRPQPPPPIPPKNPNRPRVTPSAGDYSEIPMSSSPPMAMTEAYLLNQPGIIETPTPATGSGYNVIYSLPGSYEKDFKVKKKIGFGGFGETALLRVIAAEDGGIAHGFRLPEGTILVAKKIMSNPMKEQTIYSREWDILDTLRGHRNILYAICTQRPRPANPYGHIFMEYCDLGDLLDLTDAYRANFRERMRQYGFSRSTIPDDIAFLERIPEGIAYEIMTSIARGFAWMHCGAWDWPLESAIDPKWTPIMHNDIKPDNIFLVSRQPGDLCPYPIIKIGDLGAASKLGEVAFVGNRSTASPERLKGCLRVPSTPEDDIFSLGSMMFQLANDLYPYAFKRAKSVHLILHDSDHRFEEISCPKDCRNPEREHFRAPRWTSRGSENLSGCETFTSIDTPVKTELKYPPPYARWWHNLVDHCIELERQDRPHIIDVLEKLYLRRRGRREDNIGNPLILWDPSWLSEEEQKSLKARENQLDDIWADASADLTTIYVER